MSCGIGLRRGSDLALLWLWRRPVAVAPIQPLAWEPPYVVGVALKSKKKKPPKNLSPWTSQMAHNNLLLHSTFYPQDTIYVDST